MIRTMIRLGLIGCGAHAESGHAIPLARYKAAHPDEILLAAVCDLQIERAQDFSRKYGFLAAYRNVDDMLRQENLDGCIAVVPPENISELGIKLLNLGIPCVVEKPLGASLAEAQALRDSAAATKTPNMVSVNRRFMPLLNRAIEWTSHAGPLRYVHCTLARHARQEPEFLWATAVHAVDTLRYIAGQVVAFDLRTLKAPLEQQRGMPWTCNSRTESLDASMCCLQREWWKKPMTFSATAFARRSLAPSVRNSGGAASGTADLSKRKMYPLRRPKTS